MRITPKWGMLLTGLAAGAVNGLFGAGGGMVLIPLMTMLTDIEEEKLFPSSVSMIFPMCLVSIFVTSITGGISWLASLPYLIGGSAGGLLAGLLGKRIPVKWLHKGLGILILWGGIRYLC